MALGASATTVHVLVIGETLRTVVIGIAIGGGAAVAGARLLRSLVYGVSPIDPITFIVVPLVVAAVAVLAAAIPARRASRVDPVTVLRME
jgi:ABC-type antimicrobial peptide transport system permease subunit